MPFFSEKDKSKSKNSYSRDKITYNKGYSIGSAASLNAVSQVTKKDCIFCPKSSDHFGHYCRKAKTMSPSELKDILNRERACFCCFRKGHRKVDCHYLSSLSCEVCKRKHHTFLHEETAAVKSDTGCASSSNNKLRPIARGRLVGPTGKQIEVNIMLDPCSDESFIDQETSKFLGLQGHYIDISVGGITGHVDQSKPRKLVKATIKHRHHLEKFKEIKLIELPVIMNNLNRPAVKEQVLQSKFLKNLPLADEYENPRKCNINVLIGLDQYFSVCTGKVKRAPKKPVLLDTLFGWVLLRDSENEDGPCSNIICALISTQEEKLISNQIKRFWEIEQVVPGVSNPWTKREKEVYDEFKSTLSFKDGHYSVKLPMIKEENDSIQSTNNNKALALERLSKTTRRFHNQPDFKEKYVKSVSDYINAEYAEKVDKNVEPPNSWYMPHHIVLKEESLSTKVRLIMDGSASENENVSINKRLEKGPTLQPLLNSVLLRFRIHKISLNADIQKMYLMIHIDESDRDKLRFVWKENRSDITEIYRNCVLPFGLTCSPFLAVGVVQHHLKKYESEHPTVVRSMLDSMYMDDLMTGTDNEEDAISLYENSSKIMNEANMKLRKWNSNSKRLKEMFERDGVSANSLKTISDDPEEIYKLLGLSYDTESDCFLYNIEKLVNKADLYKNRITKRSILKVSPTLYDPLGLVNPCIVTVKLIIQELWERGIEWDETVPPDIEKKWSKWVDELGCLKDLRIPRRYNKSDDLVDYSSSELHVFGDASEVAYGAVAYYKTYDVNGVSDVSLMYCKSKVAPLKKITLPRLELLACNMAAETAKYIKDEMNIPNVKTFLWSDSRIALCWIKSSSKQYKTFVSNKISQIHEISEPSEWGWCPGLSNPADLPSRSLSAKELLNNRLWWNGPNWLSQDIEKYPKEVIKDLPPENVLEKKPTVCLVQVVPESNVSKSLRLAGKLIDPAKFSKFSSLLKTTAYVNRFIFNISVKEGRKYGPRSQPLDVDDIREAENYWLQRIQIECFQDELVKLKSNRSISRESKLCKLSPYYDTADGLIKMTGRIQYSELSESEKHPIILPYKSYIVKLLIEDIHRKQLHSGINQTLISVRDRFWVLKGRQLVRRIVRSCLVCRLYQPIRLQVPMAPLPEDRVKCAYPFQTSGVDFTGPIYVKNGSQIEKSYIVVFSCANIRAIHLELVQNQSTEAFLRAFRRMVSRRGMILTFYSDNSETFKASSKEMKRYMEIMNGKAFRDFLIEYKIEWKFIVEYAAWWGGFYERMMRTIRVPLKKILGRSIYSSDEIYTILTEVEAMVNSRPLTQINDEISELGYLSPASFLIGRPLMNMPVIPVKSSEKSLRKKELNKLMVMQNQTLNQLWKTFKEEYIRNLGTVPKVVTKEDCVKDGELVLVTEPRIPRCKWRLGVIQKSKAGPDNKVRTVWIKTASGVIARPIQHISRLELDSVEDFKSLSI